MVTERHQKQPQMRESAQMRPVLCRASCDAAFIRRRSEVRMLPADSNDIFVVTFQIHVQVQINSNVSLKLRTDCCGFIQAVLIVRHA